MLSSSRTLSSILWLLSCEFFTIHRYVLLGNHRDAWTFGAVDPNSGTAALLEVCSLFWYTKAKCIYHHMHEGMDNQFLLGTMQIEDMSTKDKRSKWLC